MRLYFMPLFAIMLSTSACSIGKRPKTPSLASPYRPTFSELPNAYDVIAAIKQDLGSYNAYQAAHENDPARQNACKGSVSFKVKSVIIEMSIVGDETTAGSVGAKVPVLGYELGPSLSNEANFKNSQKVTWVLVPAPNPEPLAGRKAGPFETALVNLREAMLRASDQKPCFTFPTEQKNDVEASFQLVRKTEGQLKFDFLIFSTGVSSTVSQDTTNKITVSFEATGRTYVNPKTGKKVTEPAWLRDRLPAGITIPTDRDGILVLPADPDPNAPEGPNE